jgi:hypothetical protein
LPASFRGVTETAIKVGVAVPDFDALQAAGIQNYQGDADVAFQAFFDKINAEGGIYGRQIEPVYVTFDFTSPVTQEEACTQLAEDEQVFIVLYGLLAQNNLCLTDLNDTMVMTRSFQTSELQEASGDTLWLQLNAVDEAKTTIMAQVLAESGRLDGKTIGIMVREAGEAEGEGLKATLAELGFDSQLAVTISATDDAVAREAEQSVVGQKFQSDGVDFIFELLGGGNAAEVLARDGYTPQFAYKNLQAAIDGVTDRSIVDGSVTVGEVNEQTMFDDPDFWDNCMNVVLEANPELEPEFQYLPTGDQQGDGEPNWVNPTMISCDQTRLLKQLGEIAGAELTNDSFRAAVDELGPFDLKGYGQASFNSASKWDGLDEFYLQVYDFSSDSIQFDGDAIIIDRS